MTGLFCKAPILQGPSGGFCAWTCRGVVSAPMRSTIWLGIFIGSTVGGFIPELWGADMLSCSGVLLGGLGAFAGLWLGSRASR